jgi:hypothetical protein
MTDQHIRKREIPALNEAMAELKLKSGTIVTRNEEEHIKAESGDIYVLPAWRFLMEFSESNE